MKFDVGKLSYSEIFSFIVLSFAFFLPLSRAAISFFIIVIPILWLYKIDFAEVVQKLKTNMALFSWVIFLIYMVLSLAWLHVISETTIRELRLLLYYFTLLAIATSFEVKYTNKIINAFLAGLFISEIISYGIYFELWHFKHVLPTYPNPFMNHIDYSIFLAFGSILLLNKIFGRYQLKEKIVYILFFLSVTGNLFITGGRTGQVALLVALVVLSIIHFKMKIKTLFIALGFIVFIYGSAYSVSPIFKERVLLATNDIKLMTQEKNYTTSWGIRVAYWIIGSNIIKEHPLLGVGIGGYRLAYQEILQKVEGNYDKEFMKKYTPHSQYLLILLNFGIIGLGIFFYFIYSFLKMPIKNRELKDLSILFGTVFFVSFIADTFLLDQFTLALFCLFTGVFIANSYESKSHHKQKI